MSLLDKLCSEGVPAKIIDRPGSKRRLTEGVRVRAQDGSIHVYDLDQHYAAGTFTELWQAKALPELLVIAPNPDQIVTVLEGLCDLLAEMHARAPLSKDRIEENFPTVVFFSNGVYHYQNLLAFESLLTEAMILGKFPIWQPNDSEHSYAETILSKIIRGPTLQNGARIGSGAGAIYLPGKPSSTTLAGGSDKERAFAAKLLGKAGLVVIAASDANVTAIELDKAFVNLAVNLVGVIASIDDKGTFSPANLGLVLSSPEVTGDLESLADVVLSMGKVMKHDPEHSTGHEKLQALRSKLAPLAAHVSSSVQLVGAKIESKSLTAELTPTETWLLKPLQNLCKAANLTKELDILLALEKKYLATLRKICVKYGFSVQSLDQCCDNNTGAGVKVLHQQGDQVVNSLRLQRNVLALTSLGLAVLVFATVRKR